MKTGKSILRIISIGLCAILLVGSVPAASRAEVVERAADAAALPEIGQAGSGAVSAGAGIASERETRDLAGADQARALQQMRAGADDDEKKPTYYWTAFYVIGTAVLILVLMGSI